MSNVTGPVVVGIDGSPESAKAFEAARQEAARRGTDLHVVHVVDITPAILHLPGGQNVHTTDLAKARHDEISEEAAQAGVETVRVDKEGHAGTAITEYASEADAQLIVVGSRGLGRVRTLVLGSTAHGVINLADRSVLVVKVT